MPRSFETLTLALAIILCPRPGYAQDAERGGRNARQPVRVEAVITPTASQLAADHGARDTQQRLAELLRQTPPALVEILRLDPTLLGNDAYLSPYPGLATFVAQHPEVAHNPAFFLGTTVLSDEYRGRRQLMDFWGAVLGGFGVFLAFVVFTSLSTYLLKALVDYRR